MNSNFNRQFILIDFRLLENRDFLTFIGSSEFATYLVLRRYIWRSEEKEHYMGLHDMYGEQKLLACSLQRDAISRITGVSADNITRHLSSLVKKGMIKRVSTGRQNIYVLGEWVDVFGDGSYKLEWFYLEGKFGISKSDLSLSVRPDSAFLPSQTQPSETGQTSPSAPDNNREEHRKEKSVNGAELLKSLPNLEQPEEKIAYVADLILKQLGDRQSEKFYRLVAAKVPEDVVRRHLAEIQQDGGAKHPGKVFTSRMKQYALQRAKDDIAAA